MSPEADKLGNIAYEKACRGEGLTPDESDALQREKGIWIQPVETSLQEVKITQQETDWRSARALHRYDVTDPITGEQVVNILKRKVAPDAEIAIDSAIRKALEYTKNGSTADICDVIKLCEEGPFPSFSELFTDQERQTFHRADHTLCTRMRAQIARLKFGNITHTLIENATNALETHIVPILPKIINCEVRGSVEECLRLWRGNLRNPYRNFYFRTASIPRNETAKCIECSVRLLSQNPEYFSVQLLLSADLPSAIAGYDPTLHALSIGKWRGSCSFLDALSLIHELTHVQQTVRILKKNGNSPDRVKKLHEQYLNRCHGRHLVECVSDFEQEAYANEVELLAVQLGLTGKQTLNVAEVTKQLHLPDQEQHSVLKLLIYTSKYFPQGRKGNRYPEDFCAQIDEDYAKLGAKFFTLSHEGLPMPKDSL